MTPRWASMTTSISVYCAGFALFGIILGTVAFTIGIAFSGYSSVFGPARVINYVAVWSDVLLSVLVPEHALRSFSNEYPMFYIFGLPAIGWGLCGIPVGLWRVSRHQSTAP
jgi:steroid 5-alpha reductase family enzyme